jgi:hypothetical protein
MPIFLRHGGNGKKVMRMIDKVQIRLQTHTHTHTHTSTHTQSHTHNHTHTHTHTQTHKHTSTHTNIRTYSEFHGFRSFLANGLLWVDYDYFGSELRFLRQMGQ